MGKLLTQAGYGWNTGAAYTYGAAGRKTSESLSLSYPNTTWSAAFDYTDEGRLATSTIDGTTTTYHFDASGNLDEVHPSGQATTTLFYDAGNRLVSMGTTAFGWDTAQGRRTSMRRSGETSVTYTYTDGGRLAHYSDPNRSVEATYSYDGSGQRSQAVVRQGSLTTTSTFSYEDLSLLNVTADRSERHDLVDHVLLRRGVEAVGRAVLRYRFTDPDALLPRCQPPGRRRRAHRRQRQRLRDISL